MAQFPWLFPLPLLVPLCLPFISPPTYLASSSCDRNRPPPSQVACKLTPFAPPFTQLSHPFQIARTPTAPCLTKTTSGIFRLLLSGTLGTLLAVTGSFHLGLRLLVNWPPLSQPFPQTLPPPNSQNPNLPSASLRRPQVESGIFCPEHTQMRKFPKQNCKKS